MRVVIRGKGERMDRPAANLSKAELADMIKRELEKRVIESGKTQAERASAARWFKRHVDVI